MGHFKDLLEEQVSRGYAAVANKHICVECIQQLCQDLAIHGLVADNLSHQECSYCGRSEDEPIAAEIELIVKRVAEAIQLHYEPVHGTVPDDEDILEAIGTTDAYDLITDIFEPELVEDIRDPIWEIQGGKLCRRDPFGPTEDEFLLYSWTKFVELVKHQKRFLFMAHRTPPATLGEVHLDPAEILEEIGQAIKRLNLYRQITPSDDLFHVRLGDFYSRIEDLASPPAQYATQPNRMNPPGISMFYAAFDKVVALMETVGPENDGQRYTSGKFRLKAPIWVVDLTQGKPSISWLDTPRIKDFYAEHFLAQYTKEISKPVNRKAGYANTDYVPTQVLTEYLRYGMDHPREVSGMQFTSSKSDATHTHISMVLFFDHDESKAKMDMVDVEHKICTFQLVP